MKIIIIIFFTLISSVSIGQKLPYFPMMVCKSDSIIDRYMDSINRIKGYKMEKTLSNSGDIIYKEIIDLPDQSYYTCYAMFFRFFRFDGYNLCKREDILGTTSYVMPNVNYIKDNFTQQDDSTWEIIKNPFSPIFIEAKMSIEQLNDTICHIEYRWITDSLNSRN